MPATIVLVDRPGEEFAGQVRRLPYPYGSGSALESEGADDSTRVSLEVPTGLEVGDMARVTVLLERREDVLWLPPQALRTFEGRTFAVVQQGEAQQRVDVEIGLRSDDRV